MLTHQYWLGHYVSKLSTNKKQRNKIDIIWKELLLIQEAGSEGRRELGF